MCIAYKIKRPKPFGPIIFLIGMILINILFFFLEAKP